MVKRFANANRIWGLDVWNNSENSTGISYEKVVGAKEVALMQAILPEIFDWIRSQKPIQTLTCGVWAGIWNSDDKLKPIAKNQASKFRHDKFSKL
jgi:hypothetical protein